MKAGRAIGAVLLAPLLGMMALMMASGGAEAEDPAPKAAPAHSAAQPGAGTGTGLTDEVPEPYRTMIIKAAGTCPEIGAPLLAAQVWQESGFQERAVSPAGAQGIAQFMPGTWATEGLDGDGDGVADIWNPADAITSQASYMCKQHKQLAAMAAAGRVSGDLIDLTLAAYNSGIGKVISNGGIPPIDETQRYLPRIKNQMALYTPAPPPAGASTWTSPGAGPVTSPFGWRLHPVRGDWRLHSGTDLGGGGCGGPICAAAGGTVVFAGMDEETGTVAIDHGDGVTTSYLHMEHAGIFVKVGDTVTAGQKIAAVGSTGWSTACHLHFETRVNGTPTDPVPFMAERGVTLGE